MLSKDKISAQRLFFGGSTTSTCFISFIFDVSVKVFFVMYDNSMMVKCLGGTNATVLFEY